MYGIFMESWVIFKNYSGNSLWIVLFLAALIYLLLREKNKTVRVLFVYVPLAILLLFFFPIFRKLYVMVLGEGTTYYRVLWTLPMSATVAYAGCHLLYTFSKWLEGRPSKLGWALKSGMFALFVAVIVGLGSYVYTGTYMSKAENAYHIPQKVIDICDMIAPEEGEREVYATFPAALVYYVRQYNTNICLTYGRDSVEPVWGYYNAFYEVIEGSEKIDLDKLLELTRNNGDKISRYIILDNRRAYVGKPEDFGLVHLGTVEEYEVYEDPVAVELLKEIWGDE